MEEGREEIFNNCVTSEIITYSPFSEVSLSTDPKILAVKEVFRRAGLLKRSRTSKCDHTWWGEKKKNLYYRMKLSFVLVCDISIIAYWFCNLCPSQYLSLSMSVFPHTSSPVFSCTCLFVSLSVGSEVPKDTRWFGITEDYARVKLDPRTHAEFGYRIGPMTSQDRVTFARLHFWSMDKPTSSSYPSSKWINSLASLTYIGCRV